MIVSIMKMLMIKLIMPAVNVDDVYEQDNNDVDAAKLILNQATFNDNDSLKLVLSFRLPCQKRFIQ